MKKPKADKRFPFEMLNISADLFASLNEWGSVGFKWYCKKRHKKFCRETYIKFLTQALIKRGWTIMPSRAVYEIYWQVELLKNFLIPRVLQLESLYEKKVEV